jgi:hypothetical protein
MRRSASTAPECKTSLNALLLIGSIRWFARCCLFFHLAQTPAADGVKLHAALREIGTVDRNALLADAVHNRILAIACHIVAELPG